jgi:hypothetical protein
MAGLGQGQEVLIPSDLLPRHCHLRSGLKRGEILRGYVSRETYTGGANILISRPLQCSLLSRCL